MPSSLCKKIWDKITRPTTTKESTTGIRISSSTSIKSEDSVAVVLRLTLTGLPTPIRIHIFNYLGHTQEELTNLTLASKSVYEDCKHPGIKWKIISIFKINPNLGGSIHQLLLNLDGHVSNNGTVIKFRRYSDMIVNDINKFDKPMSPFEIDRMTENLQMNNILSLDISLPSPGSSVSRSLSHALANILPNLQKVNLSNTYVNFAILRIFSSICSHLEKITYHNLKSLACFDIFAAPLRDSKNLKELFMDDSVFCCTTQIKNSISDLNDPEINHIILFYYCFQHKALERISIKNSKICIVENLYDEEEAYIAQVETIPQNALIKLVRNAPSTLKWFRSDLTQANINMLQEERLRLGKPKIELCQKLKKRHQ
jgi:hypothetical protein